MSNIFDQDQAQRFVGPDLGPNCLQRLSANDTHVFFLFFLKLFRLKLQVKDLHLFKTDKKLSADKFNKNSKDIENSPALGKIIMKLLSHWSVKCRKLDLSEDLTKVPLQLFSGCKKAEF